MLRKMVMMRMLIGNMRRPLSIPTMISCHVICSDPGREKRKQTIAIACTCVYVYTQKDKKDFMGTRDDESDEMFHRLKRAQARSDRQECSRRRC